MIRVRVGPQSIVSVRVVSGAPVRVNTTGTAVVGAAEYSGPYDVIPRFSEQILLTAQRLMQKMLLLNGYRNTRCPMITVQH